MKKQTILFATAILSAGASMLSSCSKEEVKTYATVDVLHTSPDAPTFNVSFQNMPFVDWPLLFGARTGYQKIESGQKNIKLNTYTVDTLALAGVASFDANRQYSMFLIDSFKKISLLVLEDDQATAPNGKARMRFVQLSPNIAKVDIVKTLDSSIVFADLSFKNPAGYIDVNPGVYDWDVRFSDTLSNLSWNKSMVLITIPTFVLSNGKSYTVYTQGYYGSPYKNYMRSNIVINKD